MTTSQQAIQETLGVYPDIHPETEIERRVDFLATYLLETQRQGFVLGISGGQDSLLAGILAQKAVEKIRGLGGSAMFHAMLLPYGEQRDRQDAVDAVAFINPDKVHDYNIKPAVDAFTETYNSVNTKGLADYHKGNVKARMRMIAQYALAGEEGLVVIGTDHAAEAVTGFFTKFGDGAADILPLSGLSKRQGKILLKYLGAPETYITKQPTADLLDGKPAQADEAELEMRYEEIDDFLEGKPVAPDVSTKIIQRYDATQHKRDLPVAYEPNL